MMPEMIDGELYLTTGQAAKMLSVSSSTVKKYCKKGFLIHRINSANGFTYISEKSIQDFKISIPFLAQIKRKKVRRKTPTKKIVKIIERKITEPHIIVKNAETNKNLEMLVKLLKEENDMYREVFKKVKEAFSS